MRFLQTAAYAGILILALTVAAHAQDADSQQARPAAGAGGSTGSGGFGGDIVVTAQRREETVQTVPISINAISGQQLRELRIESPADIATLSPGVFVTGARGDQNPIFSIRGLSLNDTFANNNPEVGVYVDDVIMPYTPMMSGQLFDLERVEVLKGPQGTLYGRNTTAGAINFISVKPSQEMSAYMTGTYARFERKELEGAIGGGVTDTLAVRMSAKTVQQSSGWQTNTTTGQKIGKINDVSLRAQLLWTPTDRLSVSLEGTYLYDKRQSQQRQHVGYYGTGGGFCAAALAGYSDPNTCFDLLGYSYTDPNPRHVGDGSVYGTWSEAHGAGTNLKIDYDLGGAKLTVITAYNYYNRTSPDDSDGGAPIELDSLFSDKIQSFTQELRLTSDTAGPLTWVGGLYYSHDRIRGSALQALDDFPYHTRVDTSYDQVTDSYAAFGQATYALAPGLNLTAGLRFTRDEKRYTYNAVDLDPFGDSSLPDTAGLVADHVNQNNLSGKVGIDYKVTPDAMVYASYSRGYKAGGFKAAIAFSADELTPFRGETVDSYEAGVKTEWLDGKLTLNAAGYLNNWQNFQASVSIIKNGVSVITLANAGDARTYGFEAEAAFRPTPAVSLRLSGNWLHSEITRFNSQNGSADYAGNQLANAPKLTVTGQARWETPIGGDSWGVYLLGDASYRSKTYFSLANRDLSSESGYWLVNGRIAVHARNDKWELAAFAKNILDKTYITQAYDNWGGAFPSSNFLGDPATYGAQLTLRY